MKSRLLLIPILAIALFAVFSSCNKETAEDILVSKTWTFDKATTNSTDSFVIIMVDYLEISMSGATLKITDDGKYTTTFDGETETGTWTLSDDEKKLTITDTEGSTVLDIIDITESQLSFSETMTEEQITFTVNYYWK
jgi:hypothetical protein